MVMIETIDERTHLKRELKPRHAIFVFEGDVSAFSVPDIDNSLQNEYQKNCHDQSTIGHPLPTTSQGLWSSGTGMMEGIKSTCKLMQQNAINTRP